MDDIILRVLIFVPLGALIYTFLAPLLGFDERPLSEYTKEEIDMAFKFAPEERAEIVNSGTMSRQKWRRLVKLNRRRIDSELRRRGVR